MRFYLGTHEPQWLQRTAVPLFISQSRLSSRKGLPRACGPWALDSNGFTQVVLHGGWNEKSAVYARNVRRFQQEIGQLQWASPQDWMCEEIALRKTGLSVYEHQQRTVNNFFELREIASDLPFIPVLQGFEPCDYWRCVEMYAKRGLWLGDVPLVGLGSVCRRQGTKEIAHLVDGLCAAGIKLHGFGVKIRGLPELANKLESADSLAWSFDARRLQRSWCGASHKNCANCMAFALAWREKVLTAAA